MKDVLARVFEITRDSRDGILFLKEFQSIAKESFAIMYADSETIFESSEALFADLKILYQLDLFPLVVLENVSFQYLKAFFPLEQTTEDSKTSLGFSYQLVNRDESLHKEVSDCIQKKKIPILLWDESKEQLTRILGRSVSILKSSKVIFVSIDGPLRDPETGKVVSILQTLDEEVDRKNTDLFSDLEPVKNFAVTESQKEFVGVAKDLVLGSSDPKFNIVLTSPFTLLTELFTVKGSGTLVKKKNKIERHASTETVAIERVFDLIEDSFGKKLKTHFRSTRFDILFLEENYRACAWLNQTEYGYLLSKFAVNGFLRGAGVGRDIWDLILLHCRPLFWRSKPENTINKWYTSVADGVFKDSDWYYYWLGQSVDVIPKLITILKNEPEDFEVKQSL
ncbi:MAG: acetylglutamate kinase [Leptospira sp.]|nr:acetylglutamate kinase [Leptospira sp.]